MCDALELGKMLIEVCDPCCGISHSDATIRSHVNINRSMFSASRIRRGTILRRTFVLVANFGRDETDLAPIGRIYSGGELVLDTSNSLPHLVNTEILFKSLTLSPGQAVVIKLPK